MPVEIPSAAELLKWEKETKPALAKATQVLALDKLQRAAELGSPLAQQELLRREGIGDPLRLLRWPEEWGPMPVSPWTRPTGISAPAPGVQPQFLMSPKGWGFTEDFSTFISPEGEEFTLAEAQTELAHMGFESLVYDYNLNLFVPSTFEFAQAREAQYAQMQVNLGAIGQPGFVAPPGTPGAITIEEYNRRIAEIGTMAAEQRQLLTDAFASVFPGQTIDDLFILVNDMVIDADVMSFDEVAEATELQIEFLETIREVGRTPETELLLQTIFPTIDEAGMSELFGVTVEEPKLPTKEEAVFLPMLGTVKKLTAEEKEAAPKWVKAFASGVGDVYGAVAGAARWLGYDDIGTGLSKEAERMHREYFYPDTIGDFEFADLLNPDFYAEKIVRTIPFALSLAPLAVGGYFAGAGIATAAGLGTIWSAIVGGLTGAALSRPMESAMEAGNQYDDAIARGKTEAEAKVEADEVFRNNMVLAGADAWEIAIALAPTLKWIPSALIKGGLVRTARIGGKMVIVGLSEGGEEVYQDLISRRAKGEEWQWDPISKEVFAIGMVMGMGMGLGGDVITTIVNRSKEGMSVSQKKGFDAVTEEFKAQGFTQEQAELRALDMMAQSPEGQKVVGEAIQTAKVVEPIVIPEGIPAPTAVNIELRPIEARPGEGFEIVVDNNVVGELDFRSTEGLGITGNMLVDIEVFPEMKRKGIATQALDEVMLKSEEQKRPLFSGLLKPEGELWLKGLEKRGVIKLEKQDQKLLGYLITRPEVAPAVVPEVVPPESAAEIAAQMTKAEFVERNVDLVVKEKGRWGTIHYALKARKGDYQKVGQITSDSPEGVLEQLYDKLIQQVKVKPTVAKVPTKPPVAEVVPPEREVFSEGGVPVSPDEPIPQGVVENIPIIKDIGLLERIVRPSRKVYERLESFELHRGIQISEVLVGEAKKATLKKVNELRKSVGKNKERWGLIADEVDNKGSVKGLTFQEKRVVNWLRDWADVWANKKNLPENKRIKDYIPHLFEQEARDQLEQTGVLPTELAAMLSDRVTRKITDPFLKERLGALGWIRDPFRAVEAYEAAANRVLYYEPLLQKVALIANTPATPQIAREYLKDFSRRMTGELHSWDKAANNTLVEVASAVRKSPSGERFYQFATKGNPAGFLSYSLTSLYYPLWMGFKATTAIRNLSQHTLILAETGPAHFAKGVAMNALPTQVYKDAMNESIGIRSRKLGHPVPGLEESFAMRWVDRFFKTSMVAFGAADRLNVRSAFCAGFSEATDMLVDFNNALPDAQRLSDERMHELLIWRGDEVLTDTQYLYTKMNAMALSQSGMGRVLSVLTTWAVNWSELMVKWVKPRPSQVYLQFEKETGTKLPKKNWSATYKSIITYMMILTLGYALKERERIKAWEYTGITSVRYLANILGGDLPGLEIPGAVGQIVAGIASDDERMLKQGWSALTRTLTPSIWHQIDAVASGDKDWLTLFFYLEGRDFHIKKLKDEWEKGWKDYEDLTVGKDRNQYRKDNPLIEAQMFITSKFTTLSSEEARQEVLRLIEANNLDTELIDGYEKVFGQDTNKKFKEFKGQLGQVELDEEGEQKLKDDGELDYFTTSNFASEVNELEGVVGRTKIEQDGNSLAIEYLRARDLFVQYESLTTADARSLYRQQFPDVEAQLYLWGKITTFKNPKSAMMVLDLMEKYNIPPESIPAFLDNPEKYDELFTQKFALELNTFELDNQYENYGNPESSLYIEDSAARKLARAELKVDNPDWMADNRRIEAIDHDASPEIIEAWAERGKIIDKYDDNSPQAKVWLLDNKSTHEWALDNELLTDDGSEWNEPALRIDVKWSAEDDIYDDLPTTGTDRDDYLLANEEYRKDRRRRDAYKLTNLAGDKFPEGQIENYVDYYEYPAKGFEQERMLVEDTEFAKAMHEIAGIDLPDPRDVPAVRYDDLYKKYPKQFDELDGLANYKSEYYIEDPDIRAKRVEQLRFKPSGEYSKFGLAELERDAYYKMISEKEIGSYVGYYTIIGEGKPEGYKDKLGWYEDDWWLQDHEDFVDEMVSKGFWQPKDFSKVPTKEVFGLWVIYNNLPKGSARINFRIENKPLDDWGQLTQGWKPATGTVTPEEKEQLTLDEQIATRLAGMGGENQLLPVFRG